MIIRLWNGRTLAPVEVNVEPSSYRPITDVLVEQDIRHVACGISYTDRFPDVIDGHGATAGQESRQFLRNELLKNWVYFGRGA